MLSSIGFWKWYLHFHLPGWGVFPYHVRDDQSTCIQGAANGLLSSQTTNEPRSQLMNRFGPNVVKRYMVS